MFGIVRCIKCIFEIRYFQFTMASSEPNLIVNRGAPVLLGKIGFRFNKKSTFYVRHMKSREPRFGSNIERRRGRVKYTNYVGNELENLHLKSQTGTIFMSQKKYVFICCYCGPECTEHLQVTVSVCVRVSRSWYLRETGSKRRNSGS